MEFMEFRAATDTVVFFIDESVLFLFDKLFGL